MARALREPVRATLLAGALAGGLLTGPALSAAEEGVVSELLSSGWKIAERAESVETRPGLPPYQALERRVHMTRYRLCRVGREVLCRIEYDSQRDRITESCTHPELAEGGRCP